MNELEKYRKIYLKQSTPKNLEVEGWNKLRTELTAQNLHQAKPGCLPNMASLALTAVALLFILTVGIAQAAKPGQTLYPVKNLTSQIVTTVQNQIQPGFEKKTEEIIDLPKQINTPRPRSEVRKQTPNVASDAGHPQPSPQSSNHSNGGEDHHDSSQNSNSEVKGISTPAQSNNNSDNSHSNSQSAHDSNPTQNDDHSQGSSNSDHGKNK